MTEKQFYKLSKKELQRRLFEVMAALDDPGKGYVDGFSRHLRRKVGYPESSGGWAGEKWFRQHNPKE